MMCNTAGKLPFLGSSVQHHVCSVKSNLQVQMLVLLGPVLVINGVLDLFLHKLCCERAPSAGHERTEGLEVK